MGIKQETEVLKRSSGEKDVSVNGIVNGLESCKISNDTSKDTEINELLKNMKLDDCKGTEKPHERKAQPKEDDERGVVCVVCDLTSTTDNLVKLEQPSLDDKEEDEENAHEETPDVETDTVLGERGPMYGVPANYSVEMGHNHVASKPCKPYQFPNGIAGDNCHPAVPANFLSYGHQNTKSPSAKGCKREMVERDCEPLKFVRPQHAGPEEINNLNAPDYAANSAVGNANGRTISQVYQKQMSGGIVYAPEDHFLDDGLSNQELDVFDIGSGFNIPVDADEFLQTCEAPPPNVLGIIEQGVVGERNHMLKENRMDFFQQQWNTTHMAQFTDPFGHYYPAQQFDHYQESTSQHYQASGHKKRGSFGNDDGSDGYASDLSPSHEPQTSPTPSPRSMMDSSPAAMNGSPPRTNWSPSPPLSNLSYCSADSGVGSPMNDELNGYLSQKSPRQGHLMSPQSVSSVPGTSHLSRSPPLMTSPAYLPASKELQAPATETEDFKSVYIDTHLTDLDLALVVASEDLLSQRRQKGYSLQSVCMSNMNNNSTAVTAVKNMANNNSENYIMACQNYQLGMNAPAGYMGTNPMMNGMQQSAPNLPTTVPATIQFVNNSTNLQQVTGRVNQLDLSKNMGGCPPVNNGNHQPTVGTVNQPWQPPVNIGNSQMNNKAAPLNNCNPRNAVQIGQTAAPAPFILPPTTISNVQPPVSNHGKIPIPPINQKPKPPGQSQVFIMTTNGTVVTPVFIMPQNTPAKPASRTLRTLAPKDSTKQNEKSADVNTKPSSGGNSPTSCSNANQGDKPPSVPASNGKKTGGSSVEKLLNLARRLVAEMSTVDLKYKDEDGDTYLHVAVCRADKFMVQALLERLVRETLTEMIDKQNLQGQTPLYLAVSTNNAEMVELLIEQGADVNPFAESTTSTGSIEKTAAIHCASTKGEKHLDTLRALLKAPEINLNQVNSEGHTALNCAILAHGKRNTDQTPINSIPIIRTLLQAGADPNLQVQQSGKTALMYALESRDLDLIESTFQLVEPQKLPAFLKTQAFDSSSCYRIAESFKATLDQTGQQRLVNCLRPGSNRGVW
ncbi:hypothetical protein BsWGS_16757 [Bradybaena similaris]